MFGKKNKENNENASVTPMNMSATPSQNLQTTVVNGDSGATTINNAAPAQPAAQPAQAAQPQASPAVTLPPERNDGARATQYGGTTARATAYGNSANQNNANQSSGSYGKAVTTLGNIGNVDYSYNAGTPEKEGITPKKVVGAMMIVVFLVWAFFLYSDYDSAKSGKKPKYCFFGEEVEEYDIGTITVNKGLGYKVVRYETEDTNLLEFSALWQKNKKLEDIGRQ